MMTKPKVANTRVFWNCPIPQKINHAIAFGNISATLQKHGLYGKVSVRAYCEEDDEHELSCNYYDSNIVLQQREVDNMVVDVLKYGLYYPAPSNLVVISKYIKEETELLGVLQDLKSLSFNILVSSLDEKDDGSVSFPGFDDYQITSVPNKRMKFAPEPNIGVFWNLDYSPEIISRNGIYHNVKSALANQGHHGKVCVWAYCDDDDDDLLLPNITMVPTGNRTARFKQMLKDILLWALLNPVDYPRTVPCLMVISDIAANRQFAKALHVGIVKAHVQLYLSD
ncbi:Uncharacterized protein Rs2_18505 [Raphanus sativus]|nr:Uncharacterized protein Rs2_18505 [Raphanus sativus]